MDTNGAILCMIKQAKKSKRGISLELGKSPTWLSATLARPGSSEATTVAAIADACGYSLALVPPSDVPPSAIVIDPPEGDGGR